MKKKALLIACSMVLILSGCGSESEKEVGVQMEAISPTETAQEVTGSETQSSDMISSDIITEDQALEAIKSYCFANNPDLEGMAESEDYTVYFDVSTNEADEIVVLYRSYTGAQIRYYVNPTSGDVYVTELVPGIIDNEQKTDETFNIRDYMNKSAESAGTSAAAGDSMVSRKDGERFEGVIMLEGTEETVNYEHAVNDALGVEIDYEYEALARNSQSDKESFISIYDDASNPWNYLEITFSPENIDTVVASISDELSKEYEISTDTYELDKAGACTVIDASAAVGGKEMPKHLQKVFLIPTSDGTVIGRAHYHIEAAEGFGHSFDYMMNTLGIIR